MADEQQPGEKGNVDMFDSLGLKTPEGARAGEDAPTPPPPPPGAASHVLPAGRMRAPAKTLLGIPGPAIAKPVLGTARPSTRLRAASEANLRAAEAKPIPPPPPRRGSLPGIDVAAVAAAPPPESQGDVVSTLPPTRPFDAAALAATTVPAEDRTVDDAAATQIYDKSPVKSADESGMHLEGPAPRDAEHASIEELLAAKPAPAPSEAPIRASGEGAAGPLPLPPPPPPPGPAAPVVAATSSHAISTPPPPSSHAMRAASAPPSGHLMRAAAPVPQPPAPPPSRPIHPPSANVRAASRVPSGRFAAPGSEARISAEPAAPLDQRPRPRPRQVVTTKLPREPGKSSPMVFLLIAVMAGAAAVAFVLMPRSSTLVVNVADTKGVAVTHADVFVDGAKRCADAPCVVREIAAGPHEVKVAAAGFAAPAPRTVSVDGRRDVLADFQLAPAKSTGFKVTGNPAVKLSVDSLDLGGLPQEKRDLEPGEHKLHFSGDGYVAIDKTITIASGEVTDLGAVPLKVAKGRAILELGTPGAKVYLVSGANRKEVPQLPMAIEFDPVEKWEILATRDGFADFHEAITFDDGQAEKTFPITLTPNASPPPTTTPSASASTASPSPPPPRREAPSPPRREPRTPDAKKDSPAPSSPDDETVLKINSLPASSIMLDGKAIGETPQSHVVVSPGSHTVTFVNSELSLKKTITVDVKPGESKAAFARLRD